MFLNERTIPITLQQLIAARSRLQRYHAKQTILEKAELKSWAGYHGERTVDKHLQRFATENYDIFRDLNLTEKEPFQIDTYLFNPYFGLILEIKNILGTLYFDKYSNQMIRTYKGEREGFPNPIQQAKLHQYHLQKWFAQHKIPPIPIEWYVVFSNPATILETTPGNEQIFQKVFHANILQEKIIQLETKYTTEKIDKTTLKKLKQLLLKKNAPFMKNILQKYDISHSDIKTGVRCPICDFVAMVRVAGKWYCPNCKTYDKTAHMHSIYDYLLLNQPTMTNQECCDFLHLSSRRTSYNFLSALDLSETKRGCYQLTSLLQKPNDYFLLPKNKQWDND